MNKKGETVSKAVFGAALGTVISIPLGSFIGQRIYAISKNIPFSMLGWWHQFGLDALAGGVVAAVIISIIAWKMQKSGM